MDSKKLEEILEKHKHWINGDCEGWAHMRANLQCEDLHDVSLMCTDLQGADLRNANLRGANLFSTNLQGADLQGADLREADLREADLRHASLRNANLKGAYLRGADLLETYMDYSCLPLWCGSLGADFDSRQLKQIAYHLVKAGLNSTNATDEDKRELSKLIDYANGFHRAQECGFIKGDSEIDK